MTPAALEAEKLHRGYQDALVILGAQAMLEVVKAYGPAAEGDSATGAKVAAIIYLYRRRARNLAIALAQLERALFTGSTFDDWRAPFTEPPTILDLRERFYGLLGDLGVRRPPRARSIDPGSFPLVERIPAIEANERALEAMIDKEVSDTLRILGEEAAIKAADSIPPTLPHDERKRRLQEEMGTVRSNVATGSERIILNGARYMDAVVTQHDPKIIGWARVHNPEANDEACGWCSMLMSRGPVYRSEESANLSGPTSDFATFHPKCHCTAVKVYDAGQYEASMFDSNRKYQALWPEVTRGSRDTMKAWRKYMRQRSREVPEEVNEPVTLAVAA